VLALCAPVWGACEHSASSLLRGLRGSEGDEARSGDFESMHEKDTKPSASDTKSSDMESDSEDLEEASDDVPEFMKDFLQAKGIDVLSSGGFQLDKRYVAYPGEKRCPTEQHIENEIECAEAVEAFSRKAREVRKDADVALGLPDSVTSALEEVTRVKASLRGEEKPECIGSVDGVKFKDTALTICKPRDESMTSAMVSLDEMNAEESAASGRQPNTRGTSPDRSPAAKRFLSSFTNLLHPKRHLGFIAEWAS